MSSGQAPKRRNPSVIESSQYAPARPQVDDRRRQLESLGRDRAANERAKQDIAEMSRQQSGRARARMQLDDVEVQERKSRQIIVSPAPIADALPPIDDQLAVPDPQASEAAEQAILPPAIATTKQTRASAAARPALASAKLAQPAVAAPPARPKFEHIEHRPVVPAAPARPISSAYPSAYVRDQQYAPQEVYHHWDAPIALARNNPLVLLVLVALICVPVIWMLRQGPQTIISSYGGGSSWSDLAGVAANHALGAVQVASGEHSVVGAPSISATAIDTILSAYGSPAAGTGQAWVKLGQQYGIDPAYAVAFFIHESSAGTNPGWAGMKPDGSTTHNVGNIICAGYATCYGRFRDYGSWDEGIGDWYKLISNEYVNGRGAASVEQIIPIYAPSSDNNDVPAYINVVVSMVDSWRGGVLR